MDLCPGCGAKGSMVNESRVRLGTLITCKDCGREFWFASIRKFEAYPVANRKLDTIDMTIKEHKRDIEQFTSKRVYTKTKEVK